MRKQPREREQITSSDLEGGIIEGMAISCLKILNDIRDRVKNRELMLDTDAMDYFHFIAERSEEILGLGHRERIGR